MAEEGGSEAAEADGEALDCKVVLGRVMAAAQARDWTGLLAWESRMEELVEQAGTSAGKEALLHRFAAAHCHTGGAKQAVGLVERRIDILRSLGNSGREGSAMVELGVLLNGQGDPIGASAWFSRARDLGAQHGLILLECQARIRLGILAVEDGREQEGVKMLQKALHLLEMVDEERHMKEVQRLEWLALRKLVPALLRAEACEHDEVEPLLGRYVSAAETESARRGGICWEELHSHNCRARLHNNARNTREAAEEWKRVTELAAQHPSLSKEENAANLIREAEKCLAKRMTRVSFSSETKRSDAAVPSQDE